MSGCDVGPYRNASTMGPPINVVVAGTNIETAHGYTVDQPIRLAFDRFLDPRTVTRQSILLEDSGGNPLTDALIAYDPVTLTVSLSNPGAPLEWVVAGRQYRIVLNVPSSDGGSTAGLQAIDGATLAAPVTMLFTPGASAEPPFSGIPQMDFCRDIFTPIFTSTCAYSGCHAPMTGDAGTTQFDAGESVLGLDLSTPHQVLATAISQIADETNTGPRAATGSWPLGTPFGIDMAVITPGEPGNSFLLYKTLLGTLAPDATDAGVSSYGANTTSPISADEIARLNNYIIGNPMPYTPLPTSTPSGLSQGDLVRLSAWIAEGAQVTATCP